MNNKILSVLVLFSLVFGINVNSQDIIKTSKTHKISGKAAAPGALIDFVIDKEKNVVSYKYLTKDNKKKIVYENYDYDLGDLSQTNFEENEIEKEKAKKKFRGGGGGEYTQFVRVKNNLARQMVFEKGHLAATHYVGSPGLYGSEFETEHKEKFKDEANRIHTLVNYRTDALQYSFNLTNISEAWAPKTGFLAEGNALVFAQVNPKKFKSGDYAPGTVYKSMIVSFEDLSIVKSNIIQFKYPYYPISSVNLPDGGMAFVFIPMNKGAIAGYSISGDGVETQPDLHEFMLLAIDKNGIETARYPFQVKHINASLNLSLNSDGDYLISGFADDLVVNSTDMKPNFFPEIENILLPLTEAGVRLGSPVSYEFIKVAKTGETLFSSSIPLKAFLEKISYNKNEKIKLANADKWEKYYKDRALESAVYEYNNNYFIQLSTADRNYQLIQLNDKGEFEVSYFSPKTGDKYVETQVFGGPEKTVYWFYYEHKEGKADETWLNIVQINPENKEVIAHEIPGEQKYFVQGEATFTTDPNIGDAILYLKSGKNIYLGKLPIK